MGRDKALLEWQGVSLLERAADTLGRVFSEVIVCGDPDLYRRVGLEAVADLRREIGPLGGLESALEFSAGRSVFVLACDLVDGVLRLREVEIEKDPPALPHHALSIDAHEEPLRKHLCVRAEALLGDEVFGLSVRKYQQLESAALGRQYLAHLGVAELAHGADSRRCSYSWSAGIPETAQKSPVAGRMITAPDDSMLKGGRAL